MVFVAAAYQALSNPLPTPPHHYQTHIFMHTLHSPFQTYHISKSDESPLEHTCRAPPLPRMPMYTDCTTTHDLIRDSAFISQTL